MSQPCIAICKLIAKHVLSLEDLCVMYSFMYVCIAQVYLIAWCSGVPVEANMK